MASVIAAMAFSERDVGEGQIRYGGEVMLWSSMPEMWEGIETTDEFVEV